MSQTVVGKCENCQRETPLRPLPEHWWVLSPIGTKGRTGPLDFCSLRCQLEWLQDPTVQAYYAEEFVRGHDARQSE
jgi:hypothetical protein